MSKKLSVVIPAYNEERTIHLILDRVLAVELIQGIQKEVVLVNDCSKDNTKQAIARKTKTRKWSNQKKNHQSQSLFHYSP